MEEKKRMKLFGTTYYIKRVEQIKDDDGNELYGCVNYENHHINIASKIGRKRVSEKEQKITLLHELFHVFLKEGQYLSCSSDEPLVEWLARCTNSAIEQGIIK